MKINSIYLFKTPLDINYNNVVDVINNYDNRSKKQVVFDAFKQYYPDYKLITISRSIKIDKLNSSLTVYEKMEDIRDYNYAIVFSNEDIYFFFISDFVSENDNDIKPSTSMSLIWDCWLNNIDNFETEKECLILSGHERRFIIENGVKKPILKEKYDINLPSIKSNITSNNNVGYIKPIFLVLEVDDISKIKYNVNPLYYTNGTIAEEQYQKAFDGNHFSRRIEYYFKKCLLYCPVGLVDIRTNKLVNGIIDGSTTYYELSTGRTFIRPPKKFNSYDNKLLGSAISDGKVSEYIKRAWYTFFAPATYTIRHNFTDEHGDYTLSFNDFNLGYINLSENTSVNTPILIIDIFDSAQEQKLDRLFSPNSEYAFCTIDVKDILTNDIYDVNNYEDPIKYTYPLKYLTVRLGDENHIISDIDNKLIEKVEIKYRIMGGQPNVFIYCDDKLLYSTYGESVENGGLITKSSDALDSYLIRNGSQDIIAREMQVYNYNNEFYRQGFNAGMNGISLAGNIGLMAEGAGTMGGIIDDVTKIGNNIFSARKALKNVEFTLQSYGAKYTDLRRTPSIYHPNSGENDQVYQDRPILFISTVTPDNIDRNKILSSRFYFGENYIRFRSPFYNCRKYFDYVRTENAILPFITNNTDRTVIEGILNNGTFKNHITVVNDLHFTFSPQFTKTNIINEEV